MLIGFKSDPEIFAAILFGIDSVPSPVGNVHQKSIPHIASQ
jgi:hypothetical protein